MRKGCRETGPEPVSLDGGDDLQLHGDGGGKGPDLHRGAGGVDPREEVSIRLLFADRIPPDRLPALLDRWQEEVFLRGKTLAREREDALRNQEGNGPAEDYDALPSYFLEDE